jgi:MoaA/NifB/PqqE/SkfB family radical SAM enzyme
MISVREASRLVARSCFPHRALPSVVTAFVTHRCNADCSFCFFSDSLNVPVTELTVDEWTRIASSIGRPSLLIITGGEPFLRTDLHEIVHGFSSVAKVPRVSIPTNGSFPDRIETAVHRILQNTDLKSLCISFSIDGIGATHDGLRKLPGSFDRICQGFRRLKPLKESYGDRLVLHTASVYSALTQGHIEELVRWIETELDPDTMGLTLVREPFRGPHHEGMDIELYRQLNSSLSSRSISGRYTRLGDRIHKAKTERVIREQVFDEYISPCFAGQHSAVIKADGTVPLCESREDIIGDLREYDFDFEALWSSREAVNATKRQQSENCRCGHECFVTPNISMNPLQLLRAGLGT